MATASSLPPASAFHDGVHIPNSTTDSARSSEVVDEKDLVTPIKQSLKHHGVDRTVSPKRWKTVLKALKHIHYLTPKEVEEIMASDEIYNQDWAEEDQKV